MIEAMLWAGLLLLLLLDLFSIAARSAFLQTNHARLLALREAMEPQVNRTVPLLAALPRLRASLDLTLVLTRFGLAALTIGLAPVQPLIPVLVGAYLLFCLEWVVDHSISHNADRWALRLSGLLRVWMVLTAIPLALPLAFNRQAQAMPDNAGGVTEDELKTLVDAGQEEGVFEQGERQMIYSIFKLGETLAREIMVPRIDMLALEVNTPLPEAVDALVASGHSRVPVYDEVVDKTLGVLYGKDLLRVWRKGEEISSLHNLLRPAYFVPEAKKVDDLLAEMQSQRIHIALVVDEYGGIAGLVTLEDIVEEIVGEIWDEYDQSEEVPYQALKDGGYLFQGRVDLDDFNEVMGSKLPRDEADTLGGFIYSHLGRVPAAGETVQVGNLLLTLEQVSARRIRKVRAVWKDSGPENGEQDHEADG